MIRRSPTNQNISSSSQINAKSHQIPVSLSNMKINSVNFRPLIINGRQKLRPKSLLTSPSSSVITIKKRASSPMNNNTFNQVSADQFIKIQENYIYLFYLYLIKVGKNFLAECKLNDFYYLLLKIC